MRIMYIPIPIAHAVAIYAHAVGYCPLTMFSRICLPTPTVSSAKYSVTSAPMTLAGTLTLSAVKTYASEFGSRSYVKTTIFGAA